jgi:hypothetical protein
MHVFVSDDFRNRFLRRLYAQSRRQGSQYNLVGNLALFLLLSFAILSPAEQVQHTFENLWHSICSQQDKQILCQSLYLGSFCACAATVIALGLGCAWCSCRCGGGACRFWGGAPATGAGRLPCSMMAQRFQAFDKRPQSPPLFTLCPTRWCPEPSPAAGCS